MANKTLKSAAAPAAKVGNTIVSGKGEVTTTAPAQPNVLQASADAAKKSAMGSPAMGSSAMGGTNDYLANNAAMQRYLADNGYMALRNGLTARGVDNSRIGWNDLSGAVTIDGKDAFTPVYNIDGTTYATERDINNLAMEAYKMDGDELKAARQYVNMAGLGDIVDWDGASGMVNIGGTSIKPSIVSPDGIAYIPQSQLDKVIEDYRAKTGIVSPQGVVSDYNSRYGGAADNALSALTNQREYSYDPKTDPIYAIYKEQYERAAEDAFRRVLNDNNTSTGGASGAVISDAMAAYQYYKSKAPNMIPTLAENAYKRYQGENERLTNNLNSIRDVGNDYYKKAYTAENDAHSRAMGERSDYYTEAQRQLENSETLKNNEVAREGQRIANENAGYNAAMAKYYADNIYQPYADAQLKSAQLANESAATQLSRAKLDYIFDKGEKFGFWTEKDAEFVPELYDMYTLSPKGYFVDSAGNKVDPQRFILDYNARELYNKNLVNYNSKMGIFHG